MLVRAARAADLPGLMALAAQAGVGLTTLPHHADALARRIAASEQAMQSTAASPAGHSYLFVLESDAQIIACSALIDSVGTEQAFYNYHVGRTIFASRELGVYQAVPTLYLSNDLTGCSELATLFVDPRARGSDASKLISLCRFAFIAEHRQRFASRLIAELRGVADEAGRSPFWESLGRHFFAMDFSRADQLSGAATRAFIAELMPKHPLYTVFLSAAAQAVIGEVHPQTRPARHILEQLGFRYRDYVDIFDAGPVLESDIDQIPRLRASRLAPAEPVAAVGAANSYLLCNRELADFRAVFAAAELTETGVRLAASDLAQLGLQAGDPVRVL